MDNAPLFASCLVVSRPAVRGPYLRRAAMMALACSLQLGILGVFVLAPLFLPEMIDAPKARVSEIPIYQPPAPILRPQGPSGPPATGQRKGGGPGRKAVQPSAVPVEPPPPNPESPPVVDPSLPLAKVPIEGLPPGAGDPNGSESGNDGPSDCPGCRGNDGPDDGRNGPPDGPVSEARPGLINPVLIPASHALPKYPDLPRRARVEGTVILLIVIETDGSVGEVQVVRSPDQRWGFDLAALEAVKQWRYHPGLLAGRPVAVQASVMVEFVLSR